jgi:hypothetical protein
MRRNYYANSCDIKTDISGEPINNLFLGKNCAFAGLKYSIPFIRKGIPETTNYASHLELKEVFKDNSLNLLTTGERPTLRFPLFSNKEKD